jgi:hypothetical protein
MADDLDSQQQPDSEPAQPDPEPTVLAYLGRSVRAAPRRVWDWLVNRQPQPAPSQPAAPVSAELASPKVETLVNARLLGLEDGKAKVKIELEVPLGTELTIAIKATPVESDVQVETRLVPPAGSQKPQWWALPSAQPPRPLKLDKAFVTGRVTASGVWAAFKLILGWLSHPLVIALMVYALVISFGIERYPIFFFTDEAIETNLAANFIRDGFTNYFGEFMPTYFIVGTWVTGVGVYLQVIPFLLWGKSVLATRLVAASISFLGALGVALLLKHSFKLKRYWLGVFVLLLTPAWFLHSRTAFVYVELTGFYSLFIYFYCRYRDGHDFDLFFAILTGALAFYTHGLGQILISISGVALLVVDFRYHFAASRRKTMLWALLLLGLCLLPFVRYYLAHPGEAADQMARRSSYWLNEDLNLLQKLQEFFTQYLIAFNPMYWYAPNNVDLIRHTMKGYANELWVMAPFMALGLVQMMRNLRQPSYRTVFIALLVCPIPACIVAVGMARILWSVIPIGILTALGLHSALAWIEKKSRIPGWFVSSAAMLLLMGGSFTMLNDALTNGPTWYRDYGLYGMQYGAAQIFNDEVLSAVKQDPQRQYVVTPSWANGTEQFWEFFIPPELVGRVHLGQPIDYMADIRAGAQDWYFIALKEEYDAIRANPKFKDVQLKRTIAYPDGTTGFYVLTLRPADNLDQLLADEHIKNITPVEGHVAVNGVNYKVMYSPLGAGEIENVFDQDPDTYVRVIEANPMILDLYPEQPTSLQAVTIKLAAMDNFTVTISVDQPGLADPLIFQKNYENWPHEQDFTVEFGSAPLNVSRMKVEIKDELSGEKSMIHVRTMVPH